MAAGIRLSPEDINHLNARLEALTSAATDLTGAWPEVGRAWAVRQERVWSRRQGWAPLAASTIRRKQSLGTGEPLVRTGALLRSATSATPIRANPRFAVFGVENPVKQYAHWHVRGAGVPKRDPVPRLTPNERRDLIEALSEHITEALRAGA